MVPSIRRSLVSLVFLSLTACHSIRTAAPAATAPVTPGDTITQILTAARAAHTAPGLAAAVAHAEGPVLSGAVGVRILGKPEEITPDDRFHIGSVTKSMTATVIATLVDEGKLSWTVTVGEALPECAATLRPEYADVTLADLLAHEGGIPGFEDDKDFKAIPPFTGTPTEQRLAFSCFVLTKPPVVKPKTEFSYSNAGFSIAGVIAEKASGTSWEDLMRSRLFVPLDMKTAGFGWPAHGGAKQPWGHIEDNGKVVPHDPDGEYQLPVYIAPAGDVNLSMPDLARFLVAHLRALHGDASLLKPETARLMHTRRIKSGLGWGVQELVGLNPVSVFQGSAETFITIVAVAHDADVVVAVSANSADKEADAATKQALKQLLTRFARK